MDMHRLRTERCNVTKGKWNEITAKAMIERNHGLVGQKTIRCSNPGIKVLGAIDFLVNHRGHQWNRSE